jgi:uncharacterized protein with HEPN domain
MRDKRRVAQLAIHDMLDTIELAQEATAAMTFDRFLRERVIQLAVERAISIISEASRRIPDELKNKAPGVPWPKIAGIGNVLRHDYREVAPRAVWNVVAHEFAPLEVALRGLLAHLDEE